MNAYIRVGVSEGLAMFIRKFLREIMILGGVLLFALGYIFRLFVWCEENIGGWFVPVAIVALASPMILVPLTRGIMSGMKEAREDQPMS